MYVPPAFEEKDPAILWTMISKNPLGLLISLDQGEIIANAVPFEMKEDGQSIILSTHLAKANSQWRMLEGQDVLIVFQGVDAYVSPQWYESKREHGRVVPTWNYVMAQVRGRATVIHDRDWLRHLVGKLTDHHEKDVAGGTAWRVSDAPADYIEGQLKGIVGVEIAVAQITGKWKVSQNRPAADRQGVAAGLAAQGSDIAVAMAGLVSGGDGHKN